ncbi:nuclear transport factor 2 family protein [Gangjinia marincola]|uniref:Nuclear transport factor 2 family protein n=1 Tax=Gangjinia marincola TaxID=578463 RepID=A0ABN1MEK9_9FLAO
MKHFFLLFTGLFFIGINAQNNVKKSINNTLENWHEAAAEADFDAYFNLMTKDAVFIGTDATENWQLEEFKSFSKPYFDKGKAWSFSRLERNIYLDRNGTIAWFDELLDTQMGICRGSGVVVKTNDGWKVKHYILSIAIPNENVSQVTALKKKFDEILKDKLRNNEN